MDRRDDSANRLKAGLGPPIEGRPVPTPEDRETARGLCKAQHPSDGVVPYPLWYPSGCNCGTIAQLLADTREMGRKEVRVEQQQAIVDASNALLDVCHGDHEHIIQSHADTVPEMYRVQAEASGEALRILQVEVHAMLDRGAQQKGLDQ